MTTDPERRCTCRKCGKEYSAAIESKHRLLCGDARKAEDMTRLMDGRLADMVWTDPPYGVAIASRIGTGRSMSSAQARVEGGKGIANDDLTVPELVAFLRGAFDAALSACKPGAVWYVAAPHGPMGVAFSMVLHDLEIWRSSLVWVKDSLVISRLDYHYRHEVFYYGWKPGGAHHAVPDRCQTSVFEFPRPKRSEAHPTMKPVELIRRHIENSSSPGQSVLDQFAGSGSTLIAAEQTGRKAFLMEIDALYCDVIVNRWMQFTGRKAERVMAEACEVRTPAPVGTGVEEGVA